MLGDDGKIRAARAGLDGFLQHFAYQFGAADLDAGVSGEFQRVGKILQGVFSRERALGRL
jgi:hypothetical protein